MDELRLMQDYFRILEKCQDPDIVFKDHPTEKRFASLWLYKLCGDIYRDNDSKKLRNMYLTELTKCIGNMELSKTFMQIPPTHLSLITEDITANVNIDLKPIANQMRHEAMQYVPNSISRNYETHMSTKILDGNQGACAYLAVALGDPKDGPIWLQMNGDKPLSCPKNRDDDGHCCENEDTNISEASASFGKFILNAICMELSGHSLPDECPELEAQLQKYFNFIQDFPLGEEAKRLKGTKLRSFLLVNLQTDLVQALGSRP